MLEQISESCIRIITRKVRSEGLAVSLAIRLRL